MKKTIKLNERELKHLVMEATRRYLREMADDPENLPAGLEEPEEEGDYVDDYENDLESEKQDDIMDYEMMDQGPTEKDLNRKYNFNPDPVAALEDEDDYQELEPIYDDDFYGLEESIRRAVRKTLKKHIR